MGFVKLAYAIIKNRYIPSSSDDERQRLLIPLVETILALSVEGDEKFHPKDLEAFAQMVEKVQQQVGSDDPIRAGVLLTELWMKVDQLDRAIANRNKLIATTHDFFNKPEKKHLKLKASFHDSWNSLSWNLAIKLLKQGRLKDGWRLYEHGLRVPAKAPQRWQRSLKSHSLLQKYPYGKESHFKASAYYFWESKASVIR